MSCCLTYLRGDIERMDIGAAMKAVGPERSAYALRYRQEKDRRLSLAAALLLQQGLREVFGIPSLPPLCHTERGKPFIAGRPDVHFSLSHCAKLVACVVSRHPVGIDVESIAPYDGELVAVTMNADEQRRIALSARPDSAFTRLWTMKESLLKLTGEGLRDDMRGVLDEADAYSFSCQEHSEEGYVLTICKKKRDW